MTIGDGRLGLDGGGTVAQGAAGNAVRTRNPESGPDSGRVWKIVFDLREEDCVDAIGHGGKAGVRYVASLTGILNFLLIALAVLGGAVVSVSIQHGMGADWKAGWTLLGGCAGFAVYLGWAGASVRMVARLTMRGPMNRGRRTMRLTPQGASITSDVSDWRIDWEGIIDIIETRQLILLSTGGTIWWLPKEAVPPEHLDALIGDARAWWAAAHPGVTRR